MMGNEEIKKANRKALPKFIVLCIAAALVGGVMGYFAAANGIDGLSGSIKAAGLKFSGYNAGCISSLLQKGKETVVNVGW